MAQRAISPGYLNLAHSIWESFGADDWVRFGIPRYRARPELGREVAARGAAPGPGLDDANADGGLLSSVTGDGFVSGFVP